MEEDLPDARQGLLSMVRSRSEDDKAVVRKAAIQVKDKAMITMWFSPYGRAGLMVKDLSCYCTSSRPWRSSWSPRQQRVGRLPPFMRKISACSPNVAMTSRSSPASKRCRLYRPCC